MYFAVRSPNSGNANNPRNVNNDGNVNNNNAMNSNGAVPDCEICLHVVSPKKLNPVLLAHKELSTYPYKGEKSTLMQLSYEIELLCTVTNYYYEYS